MQREVVHAPKNSESLYLTPTQINEARLLKQKDPDFWSCSRLAKKFNCTIEGMVAYVPGTNDERLSRKAEYNRYFDNLPWTEKVRVVNRIRRRALW
jgi:hypothetical protein